MIMLTKIALAVPTNRGIRPKTVQCLLELVAHGGYEFEIIIASEGYTVAENRNYITVKSLNKNCDYLLMIDDDMTFPPALLDDLLKNQKDICGVAYHPRSETGEIIKYLDEGHIVKLEQSVDPKYKDTFEIMATGTGIILIKCEVFKKMSRPWFAFENYDTGQCKLGEDWYFCREAKKAGFKIYCDPKIKVGHLGEKEF